MEINFFPNNILRYYILKISAILVLMPKPHTQTQRETTLQMNPVKALAYTGAVQTIAAANILYAIACMGKSCCKNSSFMILSSRHRFRGHIESWLFVNENFFFSHFLFVVFSFLFFWLNTYIPKTLHWRWMQCIRIETSSNIYKIPEHYLKTIT